MSANDVEMQGTAVADSKTQANARGAETPSDHDNDFVSVGITSEIATDAIAISPVDASKVKDDVAQAGTIKEYIGSLIKNSTVLMIGANWCPFSSEAQHTLETVGAGPTQVTSYVDIASVDQGDEIRAAAHELCGNADHTSIPLVWLNGKFVGGCDILKSMANDGSLYLAIREQVVAVHHQLDSDSKNNDASKRWNFDQSRGWNPSHTFLRQLISEGNDELASLLSAHSDQDDQDASNDSKNSDAKNDSAANDTKSASETLLEKIAAIENGAKAVEDALQQGKPAADDHAQLGPLFWFPDVVDVRVIRVVGCLCSIFSVLAVIFNKERDMAWAALAVFFDFTLRFFAGPALSPIAQFASIFFAGSEPRLRPGIPKQFASVCGMMFSGLGALFLLIGTGTAVNSDTAYNCRIVGSVFFAGLAGAAGMEGFLGFCLGCLFFGWGIRFGIFPKSLYRSYVAVRASQLEGWRYQNEREDRGNTGHVYRTLSNGSEAPVSAADYCYKPKHNTVVRRITEFNLIKFAKVEYFFLPMSLSSLAALYKLMEDSSSFPLQKGDGVYDAIAVICVVIFLVLLLLYIAKAAFYPRKVMKEWHCPFRIHAFPAISITLMLFAYLVGTTEVDSGRSNFAEAMYYIGAVPQIILSVVVFGQWIGRSFDASEHVNAAWLVAPVGNFVGAIAVSSIVNMDADTKLQFGRFFFGSAFVMWIVLFAITFDRNGISNHFMDERRRPVVAIWLAAPAAGFVAHMAVNQTVDTVGVILFHSSVWIFLGLLIGLVVIERFFRDYRFNMIGWAMGFALNAFALACVTYDTAGSTTYTYSLACLAVAIATWCNVVFLLSTVRLLVARQIFSPEEKFGPVSTMMLTHAAFNGSLPKILAHLNEVRLEPDAKHTIADFAAQYYTLHIVHDEHSKHEDRVMFRMMHRQFPGVPSWLNDDHEEGHKLLDKFLEAVDSIASLVDVEEPEDGQLAQAQKSLAMLREELPGFLQDMLNHLAAEEIHIQPIMRKYIPLATMKTLAKQVYDITPASRWQVILPWIINNIPLPGQQTRYAKMWVWSAPSQAQQIGNFLYRATDDATWQRLARSAPQIVPRGVCGWRRNY
jgi:tellurite resistance protein